MYCIGGSLKNVCHFEMGGGGGGVWQMLTSSGGRSMLTVADRGGGGGVKFAKILQTSYVNAPFGGGGIQIRAPNLYPKKVISYNL